MLIEGLSARSRMSLKQVDDEEFAEQMIESGMVGDSDPNPSMSIWTPEVNALVSIRDTLSELIAVTVAAAGGKPPKVRPSPRPVTAFDRVKNRIALRKHENLVAEMESARQRS